MVIRMNKKKKLNNKGFAISSVLYSLLIMVFLIVILMMSIMASNRKSEHNLVDDIEAELNRYSISNTKITFNDTATVATPQEYRVPTGQSGWYKIELWGAAGGSTTNSSGEKKAGGKGAYTSGLIYLEENEILYFFIGGTTTTSAGGLNGGGTGGSSTGAGGGGSTDVRTVSGEWNQNDSLQSRIMVAAGGGGADGLGAGSDGGAAGGIFGTSGGQNEENADYVPAKYGSQEGPDMWNILNIIVGADKCNAGYMKNSSNSDNSGCGRLGMGGTSNKTNGGGGGSGYFGGGAGTGSSTTAGSGAGGSSFISGYAGTDYDSDGFTATTKYFVDGKMAENVNEGNGYAKIEYVSSASKDEKPTAKNTLLNNVRYIKDCTYGTEATNTIGYWTEIQAMVNGTNVAKGKTVKHNTLALAEYIKITDGKLDASYSPTISASTCMIVDLGRTYDLDEISSVHNWETSKNINLEYSLAVSSSEIRTTADEKNESKWTYLNKYNATETKSIPETTSGTRFTKWNVNPFEALPNGTYYIYSSLSPGSMALTAENNAISDGTALAENHVSLQAKETSLTQKWVVTRLNNGYYKIVESASNFALQIKDSQGQANTAVNTATGYGDDYGWTQWSIIPLGDGTYRIQARVGGNFLATRKNSFYTASEICVAAQNTAENTFSQRWIFEYASY